MSLSSLSNWHRTAAAGTAACAVTFAMLAAAERNSHPADVEKPSLKLQGRGTTRDYRYLRHGAPLTPAA